MTFEGKHAIVTGAGSGIGGFVGRDYYLKGQGIKTPYDADRLARDTLRAIERNKALLVKPRRAHAAWLFARLAPGLMQRMSIRFIAQQRARQRVRTTPPVVRG
jgi:NAD(P)-dependent dehydrogenase (short-subunit alcohol dehydrogenase family)